MKKPVAPCLDCEDRYFRCHEMCARYLRYVRDQKIYREHIRKEKEKSAGIDMRWTKAKSEKLGKDR